MRSDDIDAPGLSPRPSWARPERLYWVARADLIKAGYTPATVRLHYELSSPDDRLLIAAACRRLQAEMLAWAGGMKSSERLPDGTIAGLIRAYQCDPASPYVDLKWNTRRTYDHDLKVLEKAVGRRALSALRIGDFRRWYDEAKKPARPDAPERVRRAHGLIAMLRRIFAYGVTAEIAECERLATILDAARFRQPARRRLRLERAHVEAFVATALEAGRLSLALGTALQFETGMRQRDVIGEWEPLPEGAPRSGILLGRRRWANGLTWSDIGTGMVISKVTTKTGAVVSHDLSLCPITAGLLARVPLAERIGPLVIDETAGRPYAEGAYSREWRPVARAAGVPDAVWNMDARAGAITEAEDAGALLDEIRGAVGHTQASTTARYSRGAIGKSRHVAELRNQLARDSRNRP